VRPVAPSGRQSRGDRLRWIRCTYGSDAKNHRSVWTHVPPHAHAHGLRSPTIATRGLRDVVRASTRVWMRVHVSVKAIYNREHLSHGGRGYTYIHIHTRVKAIYNQLDARRRRHHVCKCAYGYMRVHALSALTRMWGCIAVPAFTYLFARTLITSGAPLLFSA
jgi:hypothetical protein